MGKIIDSVKLLQELEFQTGMPKAWQYAVANIINCMQEEDVAPVIHAKWVLDREIIESRSGEIIGAEYHCSECDRIVIHATHGKPLLEAYPYCHCGARMDGE